jgi:L-lysine exporter family protein LysE/ArgO
VDLRTAFAGLAFGLSLIVVIGPQNLHVLRQGLRRAHVPLVVALCAGSDLVLMAVGVAGGAAVPAGRPLTALRVGGAVFLLGYAATAARRAARPGTAPAVGTVASSAHGSAVATLSLTWLNPGVYLDTLVLLGSVANTHPGRQWWFATGAGLASVLWFAGLGFGARLLSGLFTHRRSWQALDVFVALVMTVTGLRLL